MIDVAAFDVHAAVDALVAVAFAYLLLLPFGQRFCVWFSAFWFGVLFEEFGNQSRGAAYGNAGGSADEEGFEEVLEWGCWWFWNVGLDVADQVGFSPVSVGAQYLVVAAQFPVLCDFPEANVLNVVALASSDHCHHTVAFLNARPVREVVLPLTSLHRAAT